MTRLFCDSCDTQIEKPANFDQQTAYLPGANVGVEIRIFNPDGQTPAARNLSADLCRNCFNQAVRQLVGTNSLVGS